MSISSIDLTEIMCAKLCHDIAGPIGAINNSVDFLNDDNKELRQKAMSLLVEGASESVIRLKFFRQAYGISYPNNVKNEEIVKIVDDFFSITKVSLTWSSASNTEIGLLHHKLARLIINSIIIANSCLIYGGSIDVIINKNYNKDIYVNVIGRGSSVKVDDEIIDFVLGNTHNKISTRNVLGCFVRQMANDIGANIDVIHDEKMIKIDINYAK